jgi:hypothetical protein
VKTSVMNIYHYLLPIAFLAISSPLSAQETEEKNDKIQALKVAFLTERIDLTSKEAQVFWPIYNEYQDKKDKISAQRRTTREYYKQNALTISDKEATDILNKFVSIEQQDINLFVEYNEKFKQVLPAKKVMQLYIAENQFKAWLISKLRNPVSAGNARRMK